MGPMGIVFLAQEKRKSLTNLMCEVLFHTTHLLKIYAVSYFTHTHVDCHATKSPNLLYLRYYYGVIEPQL